MKVSTDKELIKLFHNRISNIYYEQKIVPLRGFSTDGSHFPHKLPNGEIFITKIHSVFNGIIPIKEVINYTDDLLFLSDEIVYFIALLYLYQPHIENHLENVVETEDKVLYITDQTIEGKRYDMFVDILFERIYSFFDRIANLFASFFPDKFSKKENIHFYSSLEKLKPIYSSNIDFNWLLNFRDNQYKEMNEQRRSAVHKISTVTRNFNEQTFDNYMDLSRTKDLREKRLNCTNYFRQMHNSCLEGLEKTLNFFEYAINNKQKI